MLYYLVCFAMVFEAWTFVSLFINRYAAEGGGDVV
jgi:hypothetical protein